MRSAPTGPLRHSSGSVPPRHRRRRSRPAKGKRAQSSGPTSDNAGESSRPGQVRNANGGEKIEKKGGKREYEDNRLRVRRANPVDGLGRRRRPPPRQIPTVCRSQTAKTSGSERSTLDVDRDRATVFSPFFFPPSLPPLRDRPRGGPPGPRHARDGPVGVSRTRKKSVTRRAAGGKGTRGAKETRPRRAWEGSGGRGSSRELPQRKEHLFGRDKNYISPPVRRVAEYGQLDSSSPLSARRGSEPGRGAEMVLQNRIDWKNHFCACTTRDRRYCMSKSNSPRLVTTWDWQLLSPLSG